MPVAKPCVPTTSPGIPESSHATQEHDDEDEDIWAKARRGRGSAEKARGRKGPLPTPELAKAVGKVAMAAVTAALHAAGAAASVGTFDCGDDVIERIDAYSTSEGMN